MVQAAVVRMRPQIPPPTMTRKSGRNGEKGEENGEKGRNPARRSTNRRDLTLSSAARTKITAAVSLFTSFSLDDILLRNAMR